MHFAPEKVLAGTAADLRKELEATVQDVEGLFAKIGKNIYSYYCPLFSMHPLIYSSIACPSLLAAYRKCLWTERKQQLEARNQRVVQSFQSCLTKQLQELRSLVLGGVSQQQEQLLTLENHLQSFLNFKNKVFCVPSELPTYIQQFGSVYQLSSLLHNFFDVLICQAVEELKEKLKSLNALYTSQLQSMHSVVYAHEAISSSTLKALDNTVSAHPFALEEVYYLEPSQFQCLFL